MAANGHPFSCTRTFSQALLLTFCVGVTWGGSLEAQQVKTASATTNRTTIDLNQRPVPRLEPGIVIGDEKSAGYTDLVTLVLPRLSSGHVDSLPDYAKRFASMFKFTVLARVTASNNGGKTEHLLDKVGVGFAMDIQGNTVIVTEATANQYGAQLGMIDRKVLGGNEDCLDDIVQVARTSRMIVFDAKANMLIGKTHSERVIRHFLWVSPVSGRIGFLVWQLNENGTDQYAIDSRDMQLLPARYREDRQIHVSDGGFLSSIPTPARFALVTIPQGTSLPMTAKMKQVAGKKTLARADLQVMVEAVAESLNALRSTPSK